MLPLAVIASFLAILVTVLIFFLGKFLDVLIAPRNYMFIFKLSSYVKDLKATKEELRAKKEGTYRKIVEAERQSKSTSSEVEGWIKEVDDIMPEIDTVIHEYERCEDVRGLSYICSKYLAAIKCADELEKVKDLIKRGSFDTVEIESHSRFPIPAAYEVPGSLDLMYEKALEFVQDARSANVIGVWGMGGVGKTTLLKKMHNFCVGLPIFDEVILIVVSSEQSNISKVQSKIVRNLRLNTSDDVDSQARIIHNFLVNKNFLLFIDDLWKAVDLVKVGFPTAYDSKKHKVVFTTRSKDVCRNMEAKKIIEVNCLKPTQSWILFKEKVGDEAIQSHPSIPKLAKDIAKECKGLPLALITIGRAMSMKSNPDDWKITLNLLKNPQVHHVLDVDEQLLSVLKISYDYLATDQLRKCFLSISLWPEDGSISRDELIKFWMGHDVIDNCESMDEVYEIGHSLIGRLQAACLLEDSETYINHTGQSIECLKMHDVIRDLALWIASDCGKNKNKWMVKAGIQLKEAPSHHVKWSEAECISLMENRLKELPSDIPICPNLLTLLLGSNSLTCESNLNCFRMFHCLTYLDLSHNNLKCFPISICDLTELQYLNMSYNGIENLPIELRNLKKLRYLILRDSCIRIVPRGVFSKLSKLLVLDMFSIFSWWKNVIIDVEELKSMEKQLLYFGATVRTKEELSKLMLLSKLRIEDLCIEGFDDTSFHFMSIIRNPQHLKNLVIEECEDDLLEIVFDKNDIYQYIPSLNLKSIQLFGLKNLKSIIWKDITPKSLFAKLQEVEISFCPTLEDITWVIHLPSDIKLNIKSCRSMRIAINNDVDTPISTFPSLVTLILSNLNNLTKISAESLAFPELKHLIVYCPFVKTLPFDCKTAPKLTAIMWNEESWKNVEWEDDNSRSQFNQIRDRSRSLLVDNVKC